MHLPDLTVQCIHAIVSNFLHPNGLYSLPSSSVHGIFQARILEWVVVSFSRVSSQPKDQTWISCISCIAGRFSPGGSGKPPDPTYPSYTHFGLIMFFRVNGKLSACVHSHLLQPCPTLCDPMNYSLPASSVRGILQVKNTRVSTWPQITELLIVFIWQPPAALACKDT